MLDTDLYIRIRIIFVFLHLFRLIRTHYVKQTQKYFIILLIKNM